MIAKILIYMLLLTVLPDVYIYLHHIAHRKQWNKWAKGLWWLPCVGMVAFSVAMSFSRDFAPRNMVWINVYLFFTGILVLPKVLFALCSLIGWGVQRLLHLRGNYGVVPGILLGTLCAVITVYGSTIGFKELNVKHVTIYSKDLPKTFDGYRIVQFSDAHVGTYTQGREYILGKAIDSINAQRANTIVFTGDLQNMQPGEIVPHSNTFSKLRATDGVYAVLGNHDYALYLKATAKERELLTKETERLERSFGWNLLLNEHKVIKRGRDSIVIAGEENGGLPPYPNKADIAKTLKGISRNAFVVMLQHDPTNWRRDILPHSNTQLTLSGHTHNAQFSLFGWSPSQWIYKESYGLYEEGGRQLYVSCGLGGFVPFRFGATGEIVVFTLKRSHK